MITIYYYFKNLFGVSKKFDHNPKNFKLKAVPCWYGGGYYKIQYTANNGETWKDLLEVEPPLFSYDYESLKEYNWGWANITFKPEKTSFQKYKNMFKSYQDILNFYQEEENRLIKGRKNREMRLKEYEQTFIKNLQ